MQTLAQLISKASGSKSLSVGRVQDLKGGGKYRVNIGGKVFTVTSKDELSVGTRVIVSDTETGKYVVGAGNSLSHKAKEVIING